MRPRACSSKPTRAPDQERKKKRESPQATILKRPNSRDMPLTTLLHSTDQYFPSAVLSLLLYHSTVQYSTLLYCLQGTNPLDPPLCAPPLALGIDPFRAFAGEWPSAPGPLPWALLGQSLARCVFPPHRLQAPPCTGEGGQADGRREGSLPKAGAKGCWQGQAQGKQSRCRKDRRRKKRQLQKSRLLYTASIVSGTSSCRWHGAAANLGIQAMGVLGQSLLRCPGWRHTKHTACWAPPAAEKGAEIVPW